MYFAILVCVLGAIMLILCVLYKRYKKKRKTAWSKNFEDCNQVSFKGRMRNREKVGTERNHVLLKIQMYIISIWLLFVLLIPITVQSVAADVSWQMLLGRACENNVLPIICFVMIFVGYFLIKILEHKWNGTRNLSVKVMRVKSENYEYLTFFTTYIIPLICINLDKMQYIMVLFLLLIIIGMIFIKSDFYLGNPTLALLGYKLYRIQYSEEGEMQERLIITKDTIDEDDYIEAIPFDKNAWYVRRSR